jgi:cation diffusion facilitator CzcD-associated flavoprotein CzcO
LTSLSSPIGHEELGFDPDALREKYRREREKRLRPEGNKQYVYADEDHDAERFVRDPWTTAAEREAITEDVEVCIIGAGLGGIQAAVALRDVGVDSIRIIDKAGDFGGVWYWNRFPGAQCDVDSYIYLPFLERMHYIPKDKYSYAREIREHCQVIARRFELVERAAFNTSVIDVRWSEAQRWVTTTDRGDQITSRFLVVCPGGLQQPKLPGIPGIGRFRGNSFHASRWDYEYTGGSEDAPMTNLADKRVGVIGTGTTALQCVPRLGADARQLYVFQRTPSAVSARNNKKTDFGWAAGLKPGWQRERQRNFVAATSGLNPEVDLVDDGWTHLTKYLTFTGESTTVPDSADPYEVAEIEDLRVMEGIRRRIEGAVANKEVAESLKPYYRFFCKRPGFHDEYLSTFNKASVTLVDTHGRGPDEITPDGVVVDGVSYEVDCLVFCTGFDTGNGYLHGKGFDITGRDGRKLTEYWSDGMKTFQGIHVRGFPNCFLMGSTQTSISLNYSYCLLEQAEHIAYTIGQCRARNMHAVETTDWAESEWVEMIHAGWTSDRKRFALECTPSFFNNEGRPLDPNGHIFNYVSARPLAFFDSLAAWREEGELRGLQLIQ